MWDNVRVIHVIYRCGCEGCDRRGWGVIDGVSVISEGV